LGAIAKKRAESALDDFGVAAMALAAAESAEIIARDLQAANAELRAQALRYQTAIDNIAQGVCFFDRDKRLILCNRRYAEIYRLTPEQVRPGASLREIIERRAAAGTCPTAIEDYLSWCAAIASAGETKDWTAVLGDGRSIQVHCQPMPDGAWVSTHDDITELQDGRAVAKERISLQTLIDWVPDYLWVKDTESRFVVANKAITEDSGRARTSDMIGLTDFDIHAPEAARDFHALEEEVLRTGEPMIDREELVIDASGAKKWVLSTKVPLRNERDEIFALGGISRDITARKLADGLRDGQARILEMIAMRAPLEYILERLALLVESQLTGIFASVLLLNEDGLHLRVGAAPSLAQDYVKAVGGVRVGPDSGPCAASIDRREPVFVADFAHPELRDGCRQLAAAHGCRSCWATPILSHQGPVLGALALYSQSGREPMEAETRLIDVATRIASIAIERKLAEDRIQFMANHDALTLLPNRALLNDRLTQAVLFAERYDRWATVAFVDLDNFKLINDNLGHNAGDEVLKTVARRMVACVSATDTVMRLGGDEFVILLFDQPKSADTISATLEMIQSAIAQPIQHEGRALRVTSSMGVANYPNDGADADTLLANADAAMYRAKETGRDSFRFYTPELNAKVHEQFELLEELRNAVARGEFVLHYQPQVDLRTGRVFAVEALIRWNHPRLGLTSPCIFIPLAEESSLIVPIGDWVLREACRQNKAWQDAGLRRMNMCVNVSARQFWEKNLVDLVVGALRESGLEAQFLELELTESLIMQDVEQAVATMHDLQHLGVQISIDDFGTGYSSLSALKTFPVARLKIDKSFIDDLTANENDKAVATAVISLGRTLRLRVIAEGVETAEQAAFLLENNCDEMQGNHFSKPLEARELEAFMRARATPS
jgi:diguanylate cyclase (GGDEF)-like protein/PAS domain S-box-containing protein